nr:DUF4224 domain-containing protein [Pseudomonas sp.]
MPILSDEEVVSLTGRVRHAAQKQVLAHLGIPYKARPDGSPVVLRAMMEAVFGHATEKKGPASPRVRVSEARGLLAGKKGQVAQARQ